MIPFNRAVYLPDSLSYMEDVLQLGDISGDGKYTKLCSDWMETRFNAPKILLTTSCTAALEMAAILLDIHPGDEVIMPSYTFVTTANAFVLHGAKIVFVDIRPDTMNIDETLIEDAITEKTKAIVVVHYAGVGCEMNAIKSIADSYHLPIVEDAAQGVMSTYDGKALGTIGSLGCYSFHETKNYTMGEGGALIINDKKYIERAEIIREKGTNRTRFYRGEIDKYSWVDVGSSFLPSEINAAYLYPQLEQAEKINEGRLQVWNCFYKAFKEYEEAGILELPKIPDICRHNAHMFYIKFKNLDIRTKYINYMKKEHINCVFHYVPLHSSEGGKKFSRFHGKDIYTTSESERLVRLPLFYGMAEHEKSQIIHKSKVFLDEILFTEMQSAKQTACTYVDTAKSSTPV
ncbi:MAG: dTDP-4-amino-4,6-dideoxygalactose transaminase [Lachnospiraceae bacterium]|nr:dTDP-4-amino-4,6-dideoxygalactose transaminase [Lachnospiraceae bacterium]